MNFYPVNLNLKNKKCFVIGGGNVAFRKILGLLNANASVEVFSPEVCENISNLAEKNKIILHKENYSAEKIHDGFILIAATDNPKLNKKIIDDARKKNFLTNSVDGDGDFNVPSKIQRENFLLTVSTSGNSPAFSKFVRENLESEFDENFGESLKIISKYRQEVKQLLQNHEDRKIFWRNVLDNEMWNFFKAGDFKKAEAKIKNALGCIGSEL